MRMSHVDNDANAVEVLGMRLEDPHLRRIAMTQMILQPDLEHVLTEKMLDAANCTEEKLIALVDTATAVVMSTPRAQVPKGTETEATKVTIMFSKLLLDMCEYEPVSPGRLAFPEVSIA